MDEGEELVDYDEADEVYNEMGDIPPNTERDAEPVLNPEEDTNTRGKAQCQDTRCIRNEVPVREGMYMLGTSASGEVWPRHHTHYCQSTINPMDGLRGLRCLAYTEMSVFSPDVNLPITNEMFNASKPVGLFGLGAWLCVEHRCAGCYYDSNKYAEVKAMGAYGPPMCSQCTRNHTKQCKSPEDHPLIRDSHMKQLRKRNNLDTTYPGSQYEAKPTTIPAKN